MTARADEACKATLQKEQRRIKMCMCIISTLDNVIICCDIQQVEEEIQKLERSGEAFTYKLAQ